MKKLVFWFDLASTYSYLSAMRIGPLAKSAGVDVVWQPFLLGPIFKAQGMETSPFSLYPVKGRYMWQDMDRQTRKMGIPFRIPATQEFSGFPRNSVLAARAAIVALRHAWGEEFVRRVYQAEFADWQDISSPDVLGEILRELGADAHEVLSQAQDDATKAELRTKTQTALDSGLFGAPSFTVGDQLFWGNDRLEFALDHAAGSHS